MEGYVSGIDLDYELDYTGTVTEAPKLPAFNFENDQPFEVVWPARPRPTVSTGERQSRVLTFMKGMVGGNKSRTPPAGQNLQVPNQGGAASLPQAGGNRITRLRDTAYSNYFAWLPNNYSQSSSIDTPSVRTGGDSARRRTTIVANTEPARPGSFYPASNAQADAQAQARMSFVPGQRPMTQFNRLSRPLSYAHPDGRPMSTHPTADMADLYGDDDEDFEIPPVPAVPAQYQQPQAAQRNTRMRRGRESFARSAVLSYAPSLAPVPSSPVKAEGNWQRLSDDSEPEPLPVPRIRSQSPTSRYSHRTTQARLSLATSRPGSTLEVEPDSKHSPTWLKSPDSPDPNATPIVPDNAHILQSRNEQLQSQTDIPQMRQSVARQSAAVVQQPQYPQPMETKVEMAPPQQTILVNWDGPDDPANPKNWTYGKRRNMTFVMAAFAFITPFSSSSLAPSLSIIGLEFGVPPGTTQSLILSIFVLGYAFGPLFWAPLSELYGRLQVLHLANWLFLIFTIACSVAQDATQMYIFRFISGVTGSAVLGVGAGTLQDIWEPDERAKWMGLYTLGPLLGPSVGPIVGGFIAESGQWRWVFRIVAIIIAILLVLGIIFQRETYAPKILGDKAERLRIETGNYNYRTQYEATNQTKTKRIMQALARPTVMLVTQPIIFLLGLFMAYLYGVQYLVIGSFSKLWYYVYGESIGVSGLNFIGLGLGFIIGAQIGSRAGKPIWEWAAKKYGNGVSKPEYRVILMFPGSILVPIGIFFYGWTAEYQLFWLLPDIGVFFLGLGTVMSFQSIQNYLVDTFALYAASAIAAVTALRSLAGFTFPLFSDQLYESLGYGWGNSLLGFLAIGLGIPTPFLLWFYGDWLRSRSTIAVEAAKMKALAALAGGGKGGMNPQRKARMMALLSMEEKKEIMAIGGFKGLPIEKKMDYLGRLQDYETEHNITDATDEAAAKAEEAEAAKNAAAGGEGGFNPEMKEKLMATLTMEEKMEIAGAGGFKNLPQERKNEFLARIGVTPGAGGEGGFNPEMKEKLMATLTMEEKMEIAGAGGFKNLPQERKNEFLARIGAGGAGGSAPAANGAAGGEGGFDPEKKAKLMATLSMEEKMEIAGAGGFKNLPVARKMEFLARLDNNTAPTATPAAQAPADANGGGFMNPEKKAKLMALLTPDEKLQIAAAGGFKALPFEKKMEYMTRLNESEKATATGSASRSASRSTSRATSQIGDLTMDQWKKLMSKLTPAEKIEIAEANGFANLPAARQAEFRAKLADEPKPAQAGMDPEKKAKLMAVLTPAEKMEVASAGGFKNLSAERRAEFLAKIEPKPEPAPTPAPAAGGEDPEKKAKLMAVLSFDEKMEIAGAGGFKNLSPERRAEFLARIEPKPEPKPEPAPAAAPKAEGGEDPEKKAKLMAVLSFDEKMEIAGAGGFKNLSPERRAEFLKRIEPKPEPKPEPTPAPAAQGGEDPEKKAKLMAVLSFDEKMEIAGAGGFKNLSPERRAEFLKRIEPKPEPKPEPKSEPKQESAPAPAAQGGEDPEKKAKLMAVLSFGEKMEIAGAGGFKNLPAERRAEFLARIEPKSEPKSEPKPERKSDPKPEPAPAAQGGEDPEKKAKLMAVLSFDEKMEIAGAGGFKNLSPERRAEFLARIEPKKEEAAPAPAAATITPEQKQKLMGLLSSAEKMEVASAGGFKNLPAERKAEFLKRVQEPAQASSSSDPAPQQLTPEMKVKLMQVLSAEEKQEIVQSGGIAKLSNEQRARFLAKLNAPSSSSNKSQSAFAGSQDPFSDDNGASSEDEDHLDQKKMLKLAEEMGGLTDSQKAKLQRLRKGGLPNAKKLGLSSEQKLRFAAAQIGGLTEEQKRRLKAAREQGAQAAARQSTLPNVNEEE